MRPEGVAFRDRFLRIPGSASIRPSVFFHNYYYDSRKPKFRKFRADNRKSVFLRKDFVHQGMLLPTIPSVAVAFRRLSAMYPSFESLTLFGGVLAFLSRLE